MGSEPDSAVARRRHAPRRTPSPTLVSWGWDLGWFVLPGVLAAAVGILLGIDGLPSPGGEAPASDREVGVGLWIAAVLLVDVAHVWASLYRTYLDPQARRCHGRRLVWIPAVCAWFGFLLHLESPLLFWGTLAYVAIFHFIQQHQGFALLYVRAAGESPRDRTLVRAAIWAGTLAPVIYWHARLPTEFSWFLAGDLVEGLPPVLGELALWAQIPVWVAFVARRIVLWRAGAPNVMVVLLVAVPALNWHLGIVVFDDDRVFTITNVFLHGVPYLALVWLAGGREWIAQRLGGLSRRVVPVLAGYYGLLVALAFTEELLWDRAVWHERPMLFGASTFDLADQPVLMAAVVAVLTVPQATHYILDRFIWRVGPRNPRLAEQLGLRGRHAP
jgi:hypothetical protein